MNNLLTRITQTRGQCGGRPCFRGMRIRVSDILEMLAESIPKIKLILLLPTIRDFC